MFQMAPGTLPGNALDTANCGTASYLMVRSYYENNQNNLSCQQSSAACFDYPQPDSTSNGNNCTLSAQHIINLLQNLDPNPTSVTCNPAPNPPTLSNTPFTTTNECGAGHYTTEGNAIYAASSCLYYHGANDSTPEYYGPYDAGFSINTLSNIAQNEGFFEQSPVGVGTADSTGLDKLNIELSNGFPIIVQVRYKMRVKQGSDCYIDGGLLPSTDSCGGHFMVLVGMDSDPNGNVYVNDPFPGSSGATPWAGEYINTYSKAEFQASWNNNSNYYLVLRPNGVIAPVSLVANSLAFTPAQVNIPYSVTVAAAFGVLPYTFSTKTTDGTAGTGLPPGLSMDPSTGAISGTPTTVGTFSFYLEVSDSTAAAADALTSITVSSATASLNITTPAILPSASVEQPYTQSLTAAGGKSPYTWSTTATNLPTGITLASSGVLSGTPTEVQSSSFTVQLVDAAGHTASQNFAISVFGSEVPPQIESLTANPNTVSPSGTAALSCMVKYPGSETLTYVWSASSGTISGTGSSVTWTAPSSGGISTVTCSVSDVSGDKDSRGITLTVNATNLVANVSPQTGTAGSTTFTVTGSGATANMGVTATITMPNGNTTTSHTTATSSGQFSFSGFTESTSGVYSEIDSDDQTGKKSNVLSWSVSNSNPAPSISGVSPSPVPGSNSSQTLLINGSNFVSGATIAFHDPQGNAYPRSATFVSASQLSNQFDDANDGGTWTVSVTNPDSQTSGTFNFTVTATSSVPTVSGVLPSPVPSSNSSQTLLINGSNFVSGVTVTFYDPQGNAYPRSATFVSASQLSNQFDDANDAGTWAVYVSNPNGQTSTAFSFIVSAATPVLSVTPTSVTMSAAAGSTNFSVNNSGTGSLSYSSTVTSGSSWLSITSGATGGNSGTITASYTSNTGVQRSGTIQITASGASGSPATVTITQTGVAPSNTRISENSGFDLAFAPSESDMQIWLQSSPYRDIGVYVGGCNVTAVPKSGPNGCGTNPPSAGTKQTNTNLDSTWVSDVSSMGWGIMPLWVGPQASCISGNPSSFYLIDTSTSTSAYNEGVSEADSAAAAATALGMSDSIVYYDMEAYSTNNTSCSATVGQFLSGWVNELHAQGFQAGVYGAPYNAGDWSNPPDAIWAFYPDGVSTAADLNGVLSGNWVQRRIHQYCAGGSVQPCPSPSQQTWGGVTLGTSPNQGIDLDVEDGPVFSLTVSSTSPMVTTVSPNPVPSLTGAQTLTINGSNFVTGATVTYHDPQGNSYPGHATTFVSASQLTDTAFNDASDGGTWTVTVVNPSGGSSTAFNFTVSASSATPTITSVSPSPVPGSTSAQTLTINGSNFVTGATVTYHDPQGNSYPGHATTFVSASQLTDTAFNDASDGGTWTVTVVNPSGGSSTAFNFTVSASSATPTITSVSPSPVPGSTSAQTLTINGSNFVTGATVTYHDPQGNTYANHATAFVSTSQLQDNAFNNANDAGNWTVTVINPGSISSNTYTFTVTSATPTVTSVSPSPVPASASNQQLLINGNTFQNGATVTYHDPQGNTYANHATAFVSTSQLQDNAFNNANDAGNWTVTVINPGSISSNTYTFTVN
jgi:hypothetical protein